MPKLSAIAIKVPLAHVREIEPFRPHGYVDEIMAAGMLTLDGDAILIPVSRWSELRNKYGGGRFLAVPVPLLPSGAGSLIESVLKFFGIQKSKGCRCVERRDKLNRRFPSSYFIEPISLAVLIVWTAVAAILIL